MKYTTGSFFSAYEEASDIWGHTLNYLIYLHRWFLDNFIFTQLILHGYRTSMIDRFCFFVYLYLLYYIYKRLDKTLFAYSLIMGMVPALIDHFMSYSRYLLVVFPLFIIMALLLKKNYLLIVFFFLVMQAIFLTMHSLNYWVG
jgi:hypothetical protein